MRQNESLIKRNYHIASGGAIGADQFVIERLLRLGLSTSYINEDKGSRNGHYNVSIMEGVVDLATLIRA